MRTRLLAVAVAALAVTTTLAAPATAKPAKPAKPNEMSLQVLSFNDFHGHLAPPGGRDANLGAQLDPSLTPVGGAQYLATTLSRLRQGRAYTRTVAAGDLIGGSPFLSGLFHDEPAVESLNALGLDVSSVGNHEFDEGVTELLRMQDGGCHPVGGCYSPWAPGIYPGADFDWLAANVVVTATGKSVLPATKVETINGVKVGYIGMTLEGTSTLVAASGVQGVEFRDEVLTANAAATALKRQGVKTIIVMLHEGGLQTGTYGQCVGISGPIVDIAANLSPEIDLLVTGHTHQPYVCNIPDPAGQPRMVTSASSFGRVVTETDLVINTRSGEVKRDRVTSTQHLVTRQVADPTQTAILEKWTAISAPLANRVVGSITSDLTRSAGRNTESTLADLIADAQLAATAAAVNGGARIAFMNPGGVRADLTYDQISGGEQPGQVTYGEAFQVQPFGNTLVTMNLTGGQIHDLLEQQYIPNRPGAGEQLIFGVSKGFTFSFDPTGAAGDRVDAASIKLNGVTLDPTARYRIVTNSFLADGGDAFTVFRLGTDRVGGGDDLVALTDYFAVNSPVSPPEDRIAGV